MKHQQGFLEAYNRLLENMFIKKEEREYAFVQHSAEQRYLNFITNNPQLPEKIPLKMIASHIGITPIALSRIRKKNQVDQLASSPSYLYPNHLEIITWK